MKFPLRFSSVNVTNPQFPADLVTFTEEIFNGILHFLCSVLCYFLNSERQTFQTFHTFIEGDAKAIN